MDEKCWAVHMLHQVNVTEPVIDDVLQHFTSFLTDDVAYRCEWTHQEQGTWFPICSEQAGRTWPNGPPEENYWRVWYPLHYGQVIVHVLRVEGDLVGVGLSIVDTVARILHCQHVHFQHILHKGEQLHRQTDVFRVSMEIDHQFGAASEIGQVEAWYVPCWVATATDTFSGILFAGWRR